MQKANSIAREYDGHSSAIHSIKPVNFYCPAPDAKEVHLTGNFNQWRPILMKRWEDGWWFIQIWLPYGDHQYRFLVDGEPMLDSHVAGTTRDDHDVPASLITVSRHFEPSSGNNTFAPIGNQTHTHQCVRILVVDDDHDIRGFNADVLAEAGYHVDTAENAVSAWKALQTHNYDLLITDNTMPGVTGMELIKQLRYEEMTLSVILASGTAPVDEVNESPWLKIDALLPKPYSSSELLRTVVRVLCMADAGD